MAHLFQWGWAFDQQNVMRSILWSDLDSTALTGPPVAIQNNMLNRRIDTIQGQYPASQIDTAIPHPFAFPTRCTRLLLCIADCRQGSQD